MTNLFGSLLQGVKNRVFQDPADGVVTAPTVASLQQVEETPGEQPLSFDEARVIEAVNRLCAGKYYVVMNTPGDPFYRPARARLIWVNNTAQAVQNLGIRTMLAADATGLPVKFENAKGMESLRRMINKTYNVEANYELRGLFDLPGKFGKLKPGVFQLDYDIPRSVFPYCGVLHVRHPRILAKALDLGVTCIYEDHDEDHNKDYKDVPLLFKKYSNFRVIVAITEAVKARLIEEGVPEDKIIVLDSGVNSNSFRRRAEETAAIRRNLLGSRYRHLAVYSGGLQLERGIAHMVDAAESLSDTVFLLLGGNGSDQQYWKNVAAARGLSNLILPGYFDQYDLLAFQQAADVLLVTRAEGERSAITSPLKFFEYLAAGAPIVSASMAAVQPYADNDLAMTTYDHAAPSELAVAIRDCYVRFPWQSDGYRQNIDFARNFTWERRQLALLERLVR